MMCCVCLIWSGNGNSYESFYCKCPSLLSAVRVCVCVCVHLFLSSSDPAVSQQGSQAQTSGPGQTVVDFQTEPTEPGPLDCREEQYPCTRLYSVHQPCKQCLNSICIYSLRRVYVINKEICVRTVCAHEELLRADLCRDQFSRCGVVALSGQCGAMGGSCAKSCGSC
ncbi:microfibrillar-associated protein 2 isoform X2 [Carassius carassius]|uniref:microfibrillar-associated protein 2 isoform X2 n=1 Tax=Carassius carassius TaxID=217509 RepID=UPI0028692336|nr:microfibrillar-associated protein 2 isoform X2 [Carassius carassius]